MPLPDNSDSSWPPEHLRPVYAKINEWAAWFSGDPDELIAVYAGRSSETPGLLARAVRAVKRWVWGSQSSASQPRQRVHHPLAGDIAAGAADLLFADPPKLVIEINDRDSGVDAEGDPEGDAGDIEDEASDPTQDRLDELMDDGTFATFHEAANVASGMGGVFLRVCWDKAIDPDKPWIAAVHPDAAVPEFKYGRLWAVTFWRTIVIEGDRVVRHLEKHEVDRADPTNPKGIVRHGVYDGTMTSLGNLAALTDFAQTAAIAEAVEFGDEIETGHTGLAAVYIPNRRPGKAFRNVPDATAFGESDYAGAEGMLDLLDLSYSSWGRDIDLGRARLIVPSDYLQSMGRGQGAEFDLDRELYEPVNSGLSDEGGLDIKEVQFAIRWAEHQESGNQFKRDIISSAKYSPSTFGLTEGGAPVTATEVNADEGQSYTTTKGKAKYWTPGLSQIAEALLAVDKHHFQTPGIVPQKPRIEWPPAVEPDPEVESRVIVNWHTAEAVSMEERVKARRPDWTPKQVKAEVQRLKDEAKEMAPPPPDEFAFGGETPPGEQDQPDEDEPEGPEGEA
ncbi:MAG TPA: hypothetical protein VGF17_11295 [Phytomonospora sp.]